MSYFLNLFKLSSLITDINRSDIGTRETERYCEQRAIEILERFPDNRAVAVAYSKGILATDEVPEVKNVYEHLYDKLKRKVIR